MLRLIKIKDIDKFAQVKVRVITNMDKFAQIKLKVITSLEKFSSIKLKVTTNMEKIVQYQMHHLEVLSFNINNKETTFFHKAQHSHIIATRRYLEAGLRTYRRGGTGGETTHLK